MSFFEKPLVSRANRHCVNAHGLVLALNLAGRDMGWDTGYYLTFYGFGEAVAAGGVLHRQVHTITPCEARGR